MDLSYKAIDTIIHPTAAFLSCPTVNSSHDDGAPLSTPWFESHLNPSTRVPSLAPLPNALWGIDGCGGLGTHFFAYPLFLDKVPPLRINVFIPPLPQIDPKLCDTLQLSLAFHTKDRQRFSRLPIRNYLVRALQTWTSQHNDPVAWYKKQVFGSRIIFKTLTADPAKADIVFAPMHALESQLLTRSNLQSHWGHDVTLPPSIDVGEIHVMRQFQDSVSLIKIGREDDLYILKSLTNSPKFLYHELDILLRLPPSSWISPPPMFLVTKRCAFGNKSGIIGFVTPFHVPGSIRDILPIRRLSGKLDLASQIKWSLQTTRSLQHIYKAGHYYPDLRLDNVLLTEDDDIQLIDFEQRGVWCEFGPPEINFVEYIHIIATSDSVPVTVKEDFGSQLDEFYPGWRKVSESEQYHGRSNGYHLPWLLLSSNEQEYAMVYMLGRLLWCFFEGVSAPQKTTPWQSYPRESDLEFPEYRRTPGPMRTLIDLCTRGRRETLGGRPGKRVVREGGQMVLKDSQDSVISKDAQLVQQVAKEFWTEEVGVSVDWLHRRKEELSQGSRVNNFFQRPTLQQVSDELERFSKEQGISLPPGLES